MTCSDAEILIADYLDGALAAPAKAELEAHLAACPGCAVLARDAAAAVAFMERASDVEPPAELITRILFQAPAHAAHGAGARAWLRRLLAPVLQPRFAMGMAMTILSVAMLARFVMPVRQLRPADLDPKKIVASIDDQVYRGWQRTVKFYESIKFVYQIQSRLREWREQQEEEQLAAPAPAAQKNDERRLPVTAPVEEQIPAQRK